MISLESVPTHCFHMGDIQSRPEDGETVIRSLRYPIIEITITETPPFHMVSDSSSTLKIWRWPLERFLLLANLEGRDKLKLSYTLNLQRMRPSHIMHGNIDADNVTVWHRCAPLELQWHRGPWDFWMFCPKWSLLQILRAKHLDWLQ